MGSLSFFAYVLIVNLFWSLGVTMIVYAIPSSQLQYVTLFSSDSTSGTLSTLGPKVQTNVQSQLQLPLVDMAALIFYSGNLLVDLILNFFTAIPQMINLFIMAFIMFFSIDAQLANAFRYWFFILASVLYIMAFVGTILNLRSGSQQVV